MPDVAPAPRRDPLFLSEVDALSTERKTQAALPLAAVRSAFAAGLSPR